jgi:hypothetical protein
MKEFFLARRESARTCSIKSCSELLWLLSEGIYKELRRATKDYMFFIHFIAPFFVTLFEGFPHSNSCLNGYVFV